MQGSNKKGGRPKGSKSVDSLSYQEFFVKKKFCIPEQELWCLEEAKAQYEFYKEKVAEGRFSPMEDNSKEFLKIYQNGIKEIANRIYPKLKSIEHSGSIEQISKSDQISDDELNERIKDLISKIV